MCDTQWLWSAGLISPNNRRGAHENNNFELSPNLSAADELTSCSTPIDEWDIPSNSPQSAHESSTASEVSSSDDKESSCSESTDENSDSVDDQRACRYREYIEYGSTSASSRDDEDNSISTVNSVGITRTECGPSIAAGTVVSVSLHLLSKKFKLCMTKTNNLSCHNDEAIQFVCSLTEISLIVAECSKVMADLTLKAILSTDVHPVGAFDKR